MGNGVEHRSYRPGRAVVGVGDRQRFSVDHEQHRVEQQQEPGTTGIDDGWIEAIYRHCQVTTIYGGTSEVLRGIIAERGLQLPRNR